MKKVNKNIKSTFEKEMENEEFANAYRKEYQDLVLSELILAIMENDDKSIRQLAKEAGLSSTAIQKIRSGKSQDMRLKNFIGVVKACGFSIILEKDGHRISISS